MKRIVFLFAALLMLFPLACCKRADYKYTVLADAEVLSPLDDTRRPITNGALVGIPKHNLYGSVIEENSKNRSLLCIFDEETKVLFPLCFDTACPHDSKECFAAGLGATVSYTNIVSDQIIEIGYNGKNILSAIYYSLDGTIQKEIKFNMASLLTPDGVESDNYLESFKFTCRYKNKVYFAVFNYDSGAAMEFEEAGENSNRTYYCWIVCFDTDIGEFYPVSGFEVPHPYATNVIFEECTENKLSFSYADSYYYVTDLEGCKTEEVDLSSVLYNLVASGKISFNAQPGAFRPIEGLLVINYTNPDGLFDHCEFYNTNTLEKIELTETENLEHNTLYNDTFIYNGEKYNLVLTDPDEMTYYVVNSDGETLSTGNKKVYLNRHGNEGNYYLHEVVESENGFIYYLQEEGKEETETIAGITYLIPKEIIYISKADLIDGGEVTPWYYDPESGIFEQK